MAKRSLVTISAPSFEINAPITQANHAITKEYFENNQTGGSATAFFPFWLSNGSQSCIPISNGSLFFLLSSGTQQNIPLGC